MPYDFDIIEFDGPDEEISPLDEEISPLDEEIVETVLLAPISAQTLDKSKTLGKVKTAQTLDKSKTLGKVKTAQTLDKSKTLAAPRVETLGKVKTSRKTALPFEEVLRTLIEKAPGIEWNKDGTGFYIHDRDKLTPFLRDTRFTSLQKQLNLYQFHNYKTGDSVFYHHTNFNRSKKHSAPLRIRTKGLAY